MNNLLIHPINRMKLKEICLLPFTQYPSRFTITLVSKCLCDVKYKFIYEAQSNDTVQSVKDTYRQISGGREAIYMSSWGSMFECAYFTGATLNQANIHSSTTIYVTKCTYCPSDI